jgi:transcriptional regulator
MMTVADVEGSFKLNQHKTEADYRGASNALAARPDEGSQQIARLMRETKPEFFASQANSPEGSVQ